MNTGSNEKTEIDHTDFEIVKENCAQGLPIGSEHHVGETPRASKDTAIKELNEIKEKKIERRGEDKVSIESETEFRVDTTMGTIAKEDVYKVVPVEVKK